MLRLAFSGYASILWITFFFVAGYCFSPFVLSVSTEIINSQISKYVLCVCQVKSFYLGLWALQRTTLDPKYFTVFSVQFNQWLLTAESVQDSVSCIGMKPPAQLTAAPLVHRTRLAQGRFSGSVC